MRKLYLTICLIMALSPLGISRAEGQKVIDVSSRIDNVTVYPDRALVTRQAQLGKIDKSLYEVVLGELPLGIQDDSILTASSDHDNLKII